MVLLTFLELAPFFVAFIIVIIFFALLLLTLQVDVDEDLQTIEGSFFNSKFSLLILQVYRISIGEIGIPRYSHVAASQTSDTFSS